MDDVPTISSQEPKKKALGAVWSSLIIVSAMVLSYMMFGEPNLDQLRHMPTTLLVVLGVLLLAADIFIPVPSTVVVVILAQTLGPIPAVVAGTVGISLGCLGGYVVGRLGRKRSLRLVDEASSDRLPNWLRGTSGIHLLALLRPVPIIGESSVVVAGLLGLKARDVLVATTLANLALVTAYVTLTAWADVWGGFVAAVLASWSLPAIAIGLYWFAQRVGARTAGTDASE
jgi:uncharacterized membrane protein YdjX (TVP38/TMEM64 family)